MARRPDPNTTTMVSDARAGARNPGRVGSGPTGSAVLASLIVLSSCGGFSESPNGSDDAAPLTLEAVSTRPHLVTGGDVLLRVELGRTIDPGEVEIRLNGTDVRSEFRSAGREGELLGLVQGLGPGEHEVVAALPSVGIEVALALTNYPITGPIISGPHQEPFLCQTSAFERAGGEPLGAAVDDQCSVETRIDYVYLSTADGEFHPYPTDERSAVPTEVASAVTLESTEIPVIVRVETGTVNRAIYEIAIPHDPAEPEPDPWTRSAGWNGKLVYTHGGGCRAGWYQQGDRTGGVLREGLLAMGYAVASSSLNVFGQNCNDLLASETHIMLKERFVERYGDPVYTIATGGSGGSYQSHQTADNYPGVFDGIIVSSSFPDVTSSTIFTLADARLLYHYFTEVAPGKFTREQERLVSGFGSWGSIPNLSRGAARLDPTFEPDDPPEEQGGEVSLPELEPLRYGPPNPDGIRATVQDHTVNVYGKDPATGFAGRPLDNRGVQYGLEPLERGEISKEQFIALNRDIGGFDADLEHVPQRHRADSTAARRASDTGRILYGGAGLATTPVIDYRSYTDHREGGDIHMIVHQFSTRARLVEANGHADNHVMAVGGRWGFTEESPDLGVLFRRMDQWLTNLRVADTATDPAEQVVRAKPDTLVDNCWDESGPTRENIAESLTFEGTGTCAESYPAYPTPRHVAGAPLTNDIVACALKPLDPSDYSVEFTAEEWASLERIFPDGVCDWTEGDAYAAGYQGTWLSFGPSPENRAR